MIGIFADDMVQPFVFEKFVFAAFQIQNNSVPRLDLSSASTANSPLPADRQQKASSDPALRDFTSTVFGHHEGGVEADAKLADQVDLFFLVFLRRELLDKRGCAGTGDGAEIFNQLVAGHADAVIGDSQRPRFLVDGDLDAEIASLAPSFRARQGLITQFVASVGGVGYQFAEENFLLAVKRMNDDVEQTADFGSELHTIFGHGDYQGLGFYR